MAAHGTDDLADSLSDILGEGWGALMDDAIALGIAGAAAGAGIVLSEQLFTNWLRRKDGTALVPPNWQAPAMIATGLAGGWAIGKYAHRGAGLGFGAGMIGAGIAALVKNMLLKPAGATAGWGEVFASAHYGALAADDEDLLLGVGAASEVRDRSSIPGAVDGFAGSSVSIEDRSTVPGASGIGAFLS